MRREELSHLTEPVLVLAHNLTPSETANLDTKARLARARYDVLLGGLKLRQANGTLKADDLQGVNVLLAK